MKTFQPRHSQEVFSGESTGRNGANSNNHSRGNDGEYHHYGKWPDREGFYGLVAYATMLAASAIRLAQPYYATWENERRQAEIRAQVAATLEPQTSHIMMESVREELETALENTANR